MKSILKFIRKRRLVNHVDWSEELRIIDDIGRLYFQIGDFCPLHYNNSNFTKVMWLTILTTKYLETRILPLEKFMRRNNFLFWLYYKCYFRIREKSTRKKEIELIESLGKLYPEFSNTLQYKILYKEYYLLRDKATWIYLLCVYQLKQRLPSLESFLQENAPWKWHRYCDKFNINEPK